MKYEVSEEEFGIMLKGPVYITTKALVDEFGHVPKHIIIKVEALD